MEIYVPEEVAKILSPFQIIQRRLPGIDGVGVKPQIAKA
jgi:hypothetical protein